MNTRGKRLRKNKVYKVGYSNEIRKEYKKIINFYLTKAESCVIIEEKGEEV